MRGLISDVNRLPPARRAPSPPLCTPPCSWEVGVHAGSNALCLQLRPCPPSLPCVQSKRCRPPACFLFHAAGRWVCTPASRTCTCGPAASGRLCWRPTWRRQISTPPERCATGTVPAIWKTGTSQQCSLLALACTPCTHCVVLLPCLARAAGQPTSAPPTSQAVHAWLRYLFEHYNVTTVSTSGHSL